MVIAANARPAAHADARATEVPDRFFIELIVVSSYFVWPNSIPEAIHM
jgi:hypothetical protein